MFDRLACWVDEGRSIVGASVVEVRGSTPHSTGLAMAVNDAGEVVGAISGGCVDGVVVQACDAVLKDGESRALEFGSDGVSDVGLVCGGGILVWVYPISVEVASALAARRPRTIFRLEGPRLHGPSDIGVREGDWPHAGKILVEREVGDTLCVDESLSDGNWVVIIGHSGFSNALVAQANLLGNRTLVCEPRPRFASAVIGADEVTSDWPDACIDGLSDRLDESSAIFVCTHDEKFDEPALVAALRSRAGFIGALGSRKTVENRRARLAALGVSASDLDRIHSPVGLDLGGATSAETAVSIFAEYLAVRNQRTARPLRTLTNSIHGPGIN